MNKSETIGILGIGNLLVRDEGFGVHFINSFLNTYEIPDNIEVLDGGTSGIMLAPFLETIDYLFVIDVVDLDDKPGAIHCFTDQEVRSGKIAARMSPHQIGLLEILDLCKLRDKAPKGVEMITVVPQILDTGLGLSEILKAKLPKITEMLLESLQKRNVFLTRLPDGFASERAPSREAAMFDNV